MGRPGCWPPSVILMPLQHILRFLQDEAFWQACSTRAALWMEERFDLVKQTQELEQIYSSLLK